MRERYNPRNSDTLWLNVDELWIEGAVSDYWSLWFSLLRQYPLSYLDAFLDLNLYYWFPDARVYEFFYIQDRIHPWFGERVWRESFFPNLFDFYHDFANNRSFLQSIPVFSWVFSLGASFWMIFFTLLLCIVSKRTLLIVPLLPSIILWGLLLLFPLANGRYVFPIIASYPLYLAIVVLALQSKKSMSST